ncbi:hypothetical protein MSLAZ_1221 [Methanosarcina lacustris Z-7289]|uniref:Uncharacterized protein n=1 Tax=Methanosarcina lacustris Z-7289 TaxID=1434111 RepID=A0A0E3S5H8_9EURY|nr:hypothetical protein [Methanosarcina lacustris]AKB74482.1 hypothetical protein MSLAZ_1221 [Methanosarcina lacustris Z-7289]
MDQIEISKDGIKISYLRLLSDSATGFLIILIFLICFHPIFASTTFDIKLFALFLLFLLSTPLGLIINATSWFLLGWLEIYIVELCVGENTVLKYLTGSTKKVYKYEELSEYFGTLNKDNFYSVSTYFEALMYIYYPNYIKSIDYAIGCSRLLRNIALIDIVLFAFFILIHAPNKFTFYLSAILFIFPLIVIVIIRRLDLKGKNTKPLIGFFLLVVVLCNIISIFFEKLTFPIRLFDLCYLIFFLFVIGNSLTAFYYYVKILNTTRLLCDKDKNISLEEHVLRFR